MTQSKDRSDTTANNARQLYIDGRKYTARRTELTAGKKNTVSWKVVAAQFAADAEQARLAAEFAVAVDAIVANCGNDAKDLLLQGHPRLPLQVIMQISRQHSERQSHALSEAKSNRDPLAKPPAGVGFDTNGFAEILSRVPLAAGALRKVSDGLLATPSAGWPPADKLEEVFEHAVDVRRRVKAMARRLADTVPTGCDSPLSRRKPSASKREWQPFDPERTLTDVAAAAARVAKTDDQMPRVIVDTPPTPKQKTAVLARLQVLDAAAARLAAVVKAKGHDPNSGPAAVPGTYVVFFRLPHPLTGFQVGRLGRFDFPAGVYAYIGSAFGGGGLRKRTHRHLIAEKPLRWNVDHLIPYGTPIEVWWTYDFRKVEFAWAEVLTGLPGASCPAAGFGAADNRAAEAHLVRFARMPSVDEFCRRVKEAVDEHDPVQRLAVKGWSGHGWPAQE